MSYTAAKNALNKEKQKPNFLIFVCQGQDDTFPSSAERLAFMLGLKKKYVNSNNFSWMFRFCSSSNSSK